MQSPFLYHKTQVSQKSPPPACLQRTCEMVSGAQPMNAGADDQNSELRTFLCFQNFPYASSSSTNGCVLDI